MKLKMLLGLVLVSGLLSLSGCASKGYVDQLVADAEGRSQAELSTLRDKTDTNAGEITRLRSLNDQLSAKTDLAINEAKGFEDYSVIWEGEINYNFDSYELTPTAEGILIEGGEVMERSVRSIIEIAGHTDNTGATGYNFFLGQQRAGAAKQFLVERFGFSLYRLFTVSHGKNKPVAMPDESQAASKNRRVSLKIWGPM